MDVCELTKVNTIGTEAQVGLNFLRLIPAQHVVKNLTLQYTYLSQDKDEPANIQSRSTLEYLRHKFIANLDLNLWRNLDLTVKYRFQKRDGKFTATDASGNAVVKHYQPYAVTDVRLAWNDKWYKAYVEANNVFAKKYYDFGSIPQPGAWVMAGVAVNVNL